MDCDERLGSVYGKILNVLEEALFWLERPPAEGPDVHDAQRSGMFHLGVAGGLAFSGCLPGIKSEALFDDISDAAEKLDLDQVGRLQRTVAARLRPNHLPDEPSPDKSGPDWAAGFLQMLAVLNEARTAREEGVAVRYSLMAGFLVGLMSEVPWSSEVRYRHGSLKDAVLAAHDRNPESARSWVKAQSIMARERQGESASTDPRALLLEWVGDRLAAADRLSCPMFLRAEGETEDERRPREARDRTYFDSEEAAIQRAQNFGKRIAGPDSEGIWVTGSYSLNRALVLGSHEENHPGDARSITTGEIIHVKGGTSTPPSKRTLAKRRFEATREWLKTRDDQLMIDVGLFPPK